MRNCVMKEWRNFQNIEEYDKLFNHMFIIIEI